MLCRIFLGLVPTEKVFFNKPGAFHHARWMSKSIYCLKIYIFREFKLDKDDEKKLLDICLFIIFVYIKFWYLAPLAAAAPNQDLNFIKKLCEFEKVNKKLKLLKQLYLS